MDRINYYKSFDIDNHNSIEKKCFYATNNYGYNYESTNKNKIHYEKLYKKVTCKDVNRSNIKGKR